MAGFGRKSKQNPDIQEFLQKWNNVFFWNANFAEPGAYEIIQSHGLRFKLHSPPPDLSPFFL